MNSRDQRSSAVTQKNAQTMPNEYKSGNFMTQPKSQNEETRNNSTSFLEIPTGFSGMHTYPREPDEKRTRNWTYRSRESYGTGEFCFLPSGQCRNSHRFPFPKRNQQDEDVKEIPNESKCRKYYTTKPTPSVIPPVSLSYTTMRGHTPTMLLMTSTSDGFDSPPVMIARQRLERDIIQLRCSAPFKRVTKNSVKEKGSKDPKTEEETFCKHRFKRRRSKMWYSTSLCFYPFPRYSP